MNSSQNRNWSLNRCFVMAVICGALLLLVAFDGSAQTITATPNSVDPAKPQAVELSLKKADGSIDADVIKGVKSVTVGDKPVTSFEPDEVKGLIKITPPPNLAGKQQVKLLDAAGKTLGTVVELEYRSATGPNVSPSVTPTPDLARLSVEKAEARKDTLAASWWYYLIVTIMFLGVVGPFVFVITRGIKYAKATYNSPLGLPVGSFRAILAYSLVAFLGLYILASLLTLSYFAPPDFLLGIVATVIGFYFGSRSDEAGGADPKAGTVRGIVRKDKTPASGALVKFKRDDGTEPYSRITDVDGRFELRGAKPGKYKVSAVLPGSPASDEKEVTISEGSDHEIEIVIKSAATTAPPQSGTVQGSVKKPDGTAAANADVVLSVGGVKNFEAKTGVDGKYQIAAVAVGDYKIKASLSPHQPSQESVVKVTPGGQHTVDLNLQ